MDRQEALMRLSRGGKRDEAMQVIQRWVDRAHSNYQRTRSDDTRTSEYTKWALAVDFARADRELTAELVEMAGRVVLVDHGDAQKVFGIVDIPGERATLVISRRDAGDRVNSINKTGELLAALERAERSGDEVMVRAVAERALELRDAKTLNKFIESHPHLETAVERLWKAEQREHNGTIEYTMAMAGMRPTELSGMGLGSIRALASQSTPSAAS